MEILIVLLLILLNAFFALSEIALVSAKRNTIEHQAAEGKKRAKIALELINNPENFLSSIQVGITLIGIVSGAYGGTALTDDMNVFLFQFEWLRPYAERLSLILVVGSITYLSIVVGELVPKSIALSNAHFIALFCAPVIKFLTLATFPIVQLLSWSTRLILKVFHIKPGNDSYMTEDELRFMIKTARTQGVIHKEESAVHQSLFSFADQTAKSLMTHRTDVEWIDINKPIQEIYNKIVGSVHSKFPVCTSVQDDVLGIISAKTFLENYIKGDNNIKKNLQEPIYFPQNVLGFTILSTFKKKKKYLGIVIDDFGSFAGLVTLHDLTEALVGNLPDINEEESTIQKIDDGSYLLDGDTLILEINKLLGGDKDIIENNPAKFVTISGFILEKLGAFPKEGQKIEHNTWIFEIIKMNENSIAKIRAEKIKNHFS